MSSATVSVTTPGSLQIVLDLTCALVTNGMFRFRTLDPQGRLDELLQFIAANSARKTGTLDGVPALAELEPAVGHMK